MPCRVSQMECTLEKLKNHENYKITIFGTNHTHTHTHTPEQQKAREYILLR